LKKETKNIETDFIRYSILVGKFHCGCQISGHTK